MNIVPGRLARRFPGWAGFTLIELLVVIAIIGILIGLTMAVLLSSKASAKKASCQSNLEQIGLALQMYLSDSDGVFPETLTPATNPESSDADGSHDEPDYGSAFILLSKYTSGSSEPTVCPQDQDPTGKSCDQASPDHPELNSYLWNGYFLFGAHESSTESPANTIIFAERRSQQQESVGAFCSYFYHPWFNAGNRKAPEDDMDSTVGAISTRRHDKQANYAFLDSHVKALVFTQTFELTRGLNLHKP